MTHNTSPLRVLVVTPPDRAYACGIRATVAGLCTALTERMPVTFTHATPKVFPVAHALSDNALSLWNPEAVQGLRRAVHDTDVVWVHDTAHLGAVLAARTAHQVGKPLLVTQHHGVAPYPSFLRRALAGFVSQWITEPLLQRATRVTFSSDAVAEHYYRRLAFTAPVTIVPNGVDTSFFTPAPLARRATLRAKAALRDDQPVLLFADRFTTSAGVPVLRYLAKKLPTWRFWISGDGPLDPAHWFLPNVQVFRNGAAAARRDLIHAADLLILPGFGTLVPPALPEAIACGLPVMCGAPITSNIPAAKPCLITCPVDPASPERTAERWAQELLKAYESPPLTATVPDMAERARTLWDTALLADYFATLLTEMTEAKAT